MMLALGYLLESIGFPPREDLRDLSDPDVWTPVSDCPRTGTALALAVTGDFKSLTLPSLLIGELSSNELCRFL